MANMDAEWSRSHAGTSRNNGITDMRSEQHRDKQITSTVMPRRRSSTALSATKPRLSDCIKSSKTVLKNSARATVQPLIPELLVPKGLGLLATA